MVRSEFGSLHQSKYFGQNLCNFNDMKLNMFLPYHAKNQLSNPFAKSTFCHFKPKQQIFKNWPNQLIFWVWHKIWKVYMKLIMFSPYHTKNRLSNQFAKSTYSHFWQKCQIFKKGQNQLIFFKKFKKNK